MIKTVYILYDCLIKFPQSYWLKMAQTYFLTVVKILSSDGLGLSSAHGLTEQKSKSHQSYVLTWEAKLSFL
jgi:hypothetical protein